MKAKPARIIHAKLFLVVVVGPGFLIILEIMFNAIQVKIETSSTSVRIYYMIDKIFGTSILIHRIKLLILTLFSFFLLFFLIVATSCATLRHASLTYQDTYFNSFNRSIIEVNSVAYMLPTTTSGDPDSFSLWHYIPPCNRDSFGYTQCLKSTDNCWLVLSINLNMLIYVGILFKNSKIELCD